MELMQKRVARVVAGRVEGFERCVEGGIVKVR